jgi:flagellar hook assembly protein FlgD
MTLFLNSLVSHAQTGTLAQTTHVTLSIYNLSGQKVQTLSDAEYQAGTYSLRWDGRSQSGQSLSGGLYLYQLKTANGTQTKKMILKK